jgi:drug/metabolite transporter (DMT)-like permease
MIRSLRNIGGANDEQRKTVVAVDSLGRTVERRNTIARAALNRYNSANDNTLFYVLEAGLFVGGLLLLLFNHGDAPMLSTVGLITIGVGVLAAVMVLVVALFDIVVPDDRRSAGWVIFFTELIAGVILLAFARNYAMLSVTGSVVIGISILSALALVFGALVEGRVSAGARRTLWLMFWSSLVAGIVIIYVPSWLLDHFFPY